jgi:hypothetical protein
VRFALCRTPHPRVRVPGFSPNATTFIAPRTFTPNKYAKSVVTTKDTKEHKGVAECSIPLIPLFPLCRAFPILDSSLLIR